MSAYHEAVESALEARHDRYGNLLAPGLPYARGSILTSTVDDVAKLRIAWRLLDRRLAEDGRDAVFNLTGLERGLPIRPEDALFDDELAPAVDGDRVTQLALEHLGGDPSRHDVAVFNRLTAALVASHSVVLSPGDAVVGISSGYTHPSVTRSVEFAGGRFVETSSPEELEMALEREAPVILVVLTRLSVAYELLPVEWLVPVVELAHAHGAKLLVDDAGGARVAPAVFGQPRALEFGADLVATGLDKYGTVGPRLGLLGGDAELVSAARARAWELGLEARPMLYPAVAKSLEQYLPERVRELVRCTKDVAAALRARLGDRLHETPVSAQLRGEDMLELALERAGAATPKIVPYEATAALAMLLLRDHGVMTVHFAGLPPGTSALLLKFLSPEVLARFGGAEKFAEAVDGAINALAAIVNDPPAVRRLLLGE